MDHYHYDRGAEALKAELPKGKRVFPGWQPGRTVHEI